MIYCQNRASHANIQHTSKSSSNWLVNQYWWETSGNILENDQRPKFLLIWGPKWPKNWLSEAHIIPTSKSTCNEHVIRYGCETSENLMRKRPNTRIFTDFGA